MSIDSYYTCSECGYKTTKFEEFVIKNGDGSRDGEKCPVCGYVFSGDV